MECKHDVLFGYARGDQLARYSTFNSVVLNPDFIPFQIDVKQATVDAILAVPPELYDQARSEFRKVIESACADIIGQDHYAGLRICVRRPPYDPDWVAKVVAALSPRWIPSERVGAQSLDQQGA